MQVLILYYSRTGNTKCLAEVIAEGVDEIDGVTSLIKSTKEVTRDDFLSSSGIIVGSPVYFGTMAAQLKEIFDTFVVIRKKMQDKIGAAFATAGDSSGGKETTLFSIIQAMMIYGMIIVGDPLDATGHYGVSCVGAPDEAVSQNAIKLGTRVATLARMISH
ncbi:flavodoxin family protein [Chlamydiota bacterium]